MAKPKEQSLSGEEVDNLPGVGVGGCRAHPTRPHSTASYLPQIEQLTQGASKRCQVQRKGTMPVLSMVVPPVLSALTHERRSCSLRNSLTSCKSVLKCGLLAEATLITISSCNLPPTPNTYFVLILCNSNHLLTLLLLMLVSCYSRSPPEACDGRDLCHRGTSRYSA